MTTSNLDAVADNLAEDLKTRLEKYLELLDQIDELTTEAEVEKKLITRAKRAIEVLTGSELPLKGWEDEKELGGDPEPQPADATPSPGVVPVSPPTLRQPEYGYCSACGTGELYLTNFTTSKGRRIRVLKCEDSSCNNEIPY